MADIGDEVAPQGERALGRGDVLDQHHDRAPASGGRIACSRATSRRWPPRPWLSGSDDRLDLPPGLAGLDRIHQGRVAQEGEQVAPGDGAAEQLAGGGIGGHHLAVAVEGEEGCRIDSSMRPSDSMAAPFTKASAPAAKAGSSALRPPWAPIVLKISFGKRMRAHIMTAARQSYPLDRIERQPS